MRKEIDNFSRSFPFLVLLSFTLFSFQFSWNYLILSLIVKWFLHRNNLSKCPGEMRPGGFPG